MAQKKGNVERRTLYYPGGTSRPEDCLSFVQLPLFTKGWKTLGLTDDDLRSLEIAIMVNPLTGAVIPGTGGLRKMRAAPSGWNTGKSGAIRVCYVYFNEVSIVILALVYGKNRQENLSTAEKATLRKLIPEIQKQFTQDKRK